MTFWKAYAECSMSDLEILVADVRDAVLLEGVNCKRFLSLPVAYC